MFKKKFKGRMKGSSVNSMGGPATTKVHGTAVADQLRQLPLLGDHFENRSMLYYDTDFEFVGTGGILKTHYFRANDLFDPDAAAGGHQPVGFDQAMLFWEQFAVFSAKITVTFQSNSNVWVKAGIFLNPDTVDPGTKGEIMENGYVKYCDLFGASDASSGGAFHTLKRVTMTVDNPRYFSSKNREFYFSNSNFTGTVAGSPAEMNYFGVFAFTHGATTYDVIFDVVISYDARFWEPRKVAPSLIHDALTQAYGEHRDGVKIQAEEETSEQKTPKKAQVKKVTRSALMAPKRVIK